MNTIINVKDLRQDKTLILITKNTKVKIIYMRHKLLIKPSDIKNLIGCKLFNDRDNMFTVEDDIITYDSIIMFKKLKNRLYPKVFVKYVYYEEQSNDYFMWIVYSIVFTYFVAVIFRQYLKNEFVV